MSELHSFLFDGVPVRGRLVRLTGAWRQVLRRRAANETTGAWPPPVAEMLGQMLAAGTLMVSGLKFEGALLLQIAGDGPVRLAVAEVHSDLRLRATATLAGSVSSGATLAEMVDAHGKGRCAVTLDAASRQPGQQPYQGVAALHDAEGQAFTDVAAVIEHYMRQSEQLETALLLAADERVAAGLMLQRMPQAAPGASGDEDWRRLVLLARSLRREELLGLDAETLLHRLFWQEKLLRFAPLAGDAGPRFACTCSRARAAQMLRGLGEAEVREVLHERGQVEVGCEFCGQQERFDAVDVEGLFAAPAATRPPAPETLQ